MFSQPVCLSTAGRMCGKGGRHVWQRPGGMCGEGVCVAKGACVARGVCMVKGEECMAARGRAWPGGMHVQGACMAGVCMAEETSTAANRTHPTGMHPCLEYIY